MDALLRRHYDRIFALCRRMTGSDADGADAAQEALIAIVRGLPRFDGRARFSTWVYRVATNVCLDELRRQRRRPVPGLGDADEAAAADPMDDVPLLEDRVGDRIDIDAALATLPPRLPCRRRAARRLPARLRRDQPGARHPARNGSLADRARQGGGGRCARREPRSPDPSSYWVAMSDQSLSRDELASALLDGEVAGPSSVDPALAARVEEFRRAADAIGAARPTDDVVRERAIEAALAEFDAPRHQTPPTRPRSRAPSRPQRPCPAGLVGFLPSRRRGRGCRPHRRRRRVATRRLDLDRRRVGRGEAPAAGAGTAATTTAGLAASSADAAGEAAAPPNAPLPRQARSRRDLRRRPAPRGPGAGAVHEQGRQTPAPTAASRGTSDAPRPTSASSRKRDPATRRDSPLARWCSSTPTAPTTSSSSPTPRARSST